jgi:methyl-accepting chemotaxis protein
MVNSIRNTSEISLKEQESIRELIDNADKGQESMRGTIQSVQGISLSVDGIAQAIQIITGIAANTNLLSMNAAIEAAHAGEAGRGFAVVADEIRHLSENTRQNSRNISQTLKSIIDGIAVTSKQSGDTDSRITKMSKEINGFAHTMTNFIKTLNELSAESSEIIVSLESLKNESTTVKAGYSEMLSMTDKLLEAMVELTALSTGKASL